MTIVEGADHNSYTQGFLLAIIIIAFVLFTISGIYSVVLPIVASAVYTVRPNLPL
jgi:hypothetical protein